MTFSPVHHPRQRGLVQDLALQAIERALLVATMLAATGLMWLAPRLPMVDLAQHAAQVTLWRDLLLGTSRWSDLVHINLFTPYLIGYGLTLPFSFVLPIEDAVRVVLSLAFVGFMTGCVALRRSFGGDPKLDWLFFFGFFGFAWQNGFMTFLVASPVTLGFLVLALRHAETPTLRRGIAVVALGFILLFSHGLAFFMGVGIGAALAVRATLTASSHRRCAALAPTVVLLLGCGLFRAVSAQAEGAMRYDAWSYETAVWRKPFAALTYVTGLDGGWHWATVGLTLVALLAPWLRGSAIQRRIGWVPFAALCVFIAMMPDYAFQTDCLFQRFSLFLIPFYALMFRSAGPQADRLGFDWTVLPLACAVWLLIGLQGERIAAFGAEARAFDTVLQAAEPGKRAFAFIADPGSEAASNPNAYRHFAAWYQADQGGFVDFNFAVFHPQVVRFRPGKTPTTPIDLGGRPDRFGETRPGIRYDYTFVRGSADDVARVVASSRCPLTVKATQDRWTLLERSACP